MIKSGYFYLTQVLTKLTKLESVVFYVHKDDLRSVKMKCLKAINKGLNNLIEAGGDKKLTSISFYNISAEGNHAEIVDAVFSPIYKL